MTWWSTHETLIDILFKYLTMNLLECLCFLGAYCSYFQYIWTSYVFRRWACCKQLRGTGTIWFPLSIWCIKLLILIWALSHHYSYVLTRQSANNHWLFMVMGSKQEASNMYRTWYVTFCSLYVYWPLFEVIWLMTNLLMGSMSSNSS